MAAKSKRELYGFSKAVAKTVKKNAGGIYTQAFPQTQVYRKSGGGAHYLYTLTAGMSSGTGTATIRNMADDAEIATGKTIVDTLGMFDGLAIGRRGICVKSAGVYYAIGPYVTAVRWDDPDLEYTKDGTNWTNVDIAEDC